MMVNSSYSRPLQGISQQPSETRQEGQCTWQLNMQPNIVDGLTKRIGTTLISKLTHSIHPEAKIHFYNRGDSERYWIILNPNSEINIYTEDGTPVRLETPDNNSKLYVNSESPKRDIEFQTISDYTFILNKTKVPAKSNEIEAPLTNTALVPVHFIDYGKTYSISLNGAIVASFVAPDGSIPSHAAEVDTTKVAKNLSEQIHKGGTAQKVVPVYRETATSMYISTTDVDPNTFQYATIRNIHGTYEHLTAWKVSGTKIYLNYFLQNQYLIGDTVTAYYASSAADGFSCYTIENTLVISSANSFTIGTLDGRDGNDMPAIYHQAPEIGSLPKYAPVGYPVQIVGKGKAEKDNYWLRANKGASGGSAVSWQESRSPNENFALDAKTMPQSLVREFDGNTPVFKLLPVEWDERKVGGNLNNPFPSFIEDAAPIRAIGVFQNRLFMLAGESFVASMSNKFFNFFKETTQTEAEDNPIDKYADTEEINFLESYAALDGDLVLFSKAAQFVIKGDKAITSENMNMRLVTQYENNAHIKPATTGETTLFSYNIGNYVQIREFFTDSYTDTKKARPITEHVDKLIEGNVVQLVGSTNVNNIIVRTDRYKNRMYMYDYLWQGQEKVQSAWWVFDIRNTDQIIHATYDRNMLRLITHRSGYGYCLEAYDVGDPNDLGMQFGIRMDMKKPVTIIRHPTIPNKWTTTLPQGYTSDDLVDIVLGEGSYPEEKGNTATFTLEPASGVYTIEPADLSSEQTLYGWIGVDYTAEYEPTMPMIKDEKNNVYGLDRLTVNTMYLNYQDTGQFDCVVRNKWGQSREYSYSGRVMGRLGNIVGFAKLASGQFPVPIRDKSDGSSLTIKTDSYLPFALRNIEWKGMIHLRGKRV